MSLKKFFIIVFTMLTVFKTVQAQQTDSVYNVLNEIVITATKTPKKISETGKVVAIITQQQIQQGGGKDLAQLLNEQTGITVNGANSNGGKDKSLYLRGASDKYTLILLNGLPLNDPSTPGGTYDIRLIPLASIERIEILKGSQSVLYGSNAVAGVINIITKQANSSKIQANGSANYGSFHTFKANAEVGQSTKAIDYNVSYAYQNTDGFSEAKDTTGNAGFDKDGFKQQGIQITTTIHPGKNWKIAPFYRYSEFKGDYDDGAFSDGNNRYQSYLINTGLAGNWNYEKGTIYWNYNYNFTRRNYQTLYGNYDYNARFHHADVFIHHRFPKILQLVGGVNMQTYQMKTPDTTNTLVSPYLSAFIKVQHLNIEVGGRFNHHNQYGSNWNFSFNPSYLIQNKWKIFANFSSGFRAPSVSELFGQWGANPSLKPEKSLNFEGGIGAEGLQHRLYAQAVFFNRRIKDVIVYVTNAVTYESLYINRDKQHDYGIEAELTFAATKKLQTKLSYTFVDGNITERLENKDTSYYNLLRKPKHTVFIFAGYQLTPHVYVNNSVQIISNRKDLFFDMNDFSSKEIHLKAYALWNAYVEYKCFKNKLHVFANVNNITNNKNYYEVYGYNVAPCTFTGGIQFQLP